MKVLFVGPVSPPITGHSLACRVLVDELTKHHDIDVVDLGKNSLIHGVDSMARVRAVLRILVDVWRKNRRADVIYLTISESIAGNLKDIVIYLLCYPRLSRLVIHVHGGSLKSWILDRSRLLYVVNKFFIRRLGGVVVLGPTHIGTFDGFITPSRLHVVPNFSEDYLFTTEEAIREKFDDIHPLRVLFLSNLTEGKGFNELIAAYGQLSDELKSKVTVDIAGAFESPALQQEFLDKIDQLPNVHYRGVVEGPEKKALLSRAHVLCLPSTLSEGQPIVILEAYASGCAVMTTNRGGIPDIFKHNVNGYVVEAKSVTSVADTLAACVADPKNLATMAATNFRDASAKYRTSQFNGSLVKILANVSNGAHAD